MAIGPKLIGNVLNSLPLDRMFGGPLMAVITAQINSSKAFADFLMTVCIKDGRAVMVQFDYEETLVDTEGTLTGTHTKTLRVPLMALIPLPIMGFEDGEITFDLEISQSAEETTKKSAEGSFEAKVGWGPFSLKMSGKASASSERTRKTDSRAKYHVTTRFKRLDPPEGLARIIDFMIDSSTKPVALPQNRPMTDEGKLKGLKGDYTPDQGGDSTPAPAAG